MKITFDLYRKWMIPTMIMQIFQSSLAKRKLDGYLGRVICSIRYTNLVDMDNILPLIMKFDFSGFGDAARIYGGTDHHPKFCRTLKSQLLQVRIQNNFCFYGC